MFHVEHLERHDAVMNGFSCIIPQKALHWNKDVKSVGQFQIIEKYAWR